MKFHRFVHTINYVKLELIDEDDEQISSVLYLLDSIAFH